MEIIGGEKTVVEHVEFVCPACGEKMTAVAMDGIVAGYCAKTKQTVTAKI